MVVDVLPVRRGADNARNARRLQGAQPFQHARQRVDSARHDHLAVNGFLAQGKTGDLRGLRAPLQKLGDDDFILHPKALFEMVRRQDLANLAGHQFPARLVVLRRIDDHAIPIKNRAAFRSSHLTI